MRWHPKRCDLCGVHASDDVHISARGMCLPCGERRIVENNLQLQSHSGPWFDYWRRQLAASVGALLISDIEEFLRDE